MSKRSEKAKRYKRTYGITMRQRQAMLDMPSIMPPHKKGGCNICGNKPKPGQKPPAVDHEHPPYRRLKKGEKKPQGRVRGRLCYRCNARLLGRGREDPALHLAAAEYLTRKGSDGQLFDGRRI